MEKEDEGDSCHLSTISRKTCFRSEDSMKKPVMRCEKVEEVLKRCIGRPAEVIKSHKEITEEPIDEERHFHEVNPLAKIPELVEGHLSAGIESFVEAAEGWANELFGQFGFYRRNDDLEHHDWTRRPSFQFPPSPQPSAPKDEDYSEYSSNFEEV